MNYSVFKLQNQSGKPGIFWEKESIPKNDRKFGYKKKNQRFTLRRYPGDIGHVETDLVALTPDEAPAPPPKPAKNFIKKNKEKLAVKGKPDGSSAITLTQEQLNAILRSVDKKTDKNSEITVESPRHRKDGDYHDNYEDNEEYEERREKKRNKKKRDSPDDELAGGTSIYDLLNKQSKPKNTSKDRQSRRKHVDDDEDELDIKPQKARSRKTYNRDDDDDDDDDDRENRRRRTKSKNTKKYASDEEEELVETRGRRNRSKHRHHDDSDLRDEDDEKENRRKNVRKTKKRDDSYDEDIDDRDYDRRERTKRRDKSRRDDHSTEKRDRSEKREKGRHVSNERDSNHHPVNNTEEEESASPRDKIGLPNDLSWRHMSKAERKRLEMARQKFLDEEEKREEERIRQLQYKYGGVSSEPVSQSPPKRIVTRSDPATRIERADRGRDTDLSTHTDHYRRHRRSVSPSETRSPTRSPEELPVTTSPKAMPVPQRHLSLAERKRLEWERERVESKVREQQETWDPWGRPGAGAPLRSKSGHVAAEYRGRQVRKASYAGKVMMMF